MSLQWLSFRFNNGPIMEYVQFNRKWAHILPIESLQSINFMGEMIYWWDCCSIETLTYALLIWLIIYKDPLLLKLNMKCEM